MLLRDNEPGGMAVAFDRPEPTFRDDIVEDYKGNRPEYADLLVPQFALVRAVLGALGIVIVEKPGFEATTSWPPRYPRARRWAQRGGGER